MNLKKLKILIVIAVVINFFGCGRKSEDLAPPQIINETAAIVNGKEIPLKTVNNLYNQLPPSHKDYYLHKKGRRTFLEDLIDRELIFQAAINESSLWNKEEIEKIKTNFMKRAIITKFLDHEFESLPPVTENEINKYYREHNEYNTRSLEQIKQMLQNKLMTEKQKSKKSEIVNLLQSMELVVLKRENLEFLGLEYKKLETHKKKPLFIINEKQMSLEDAINYYRPEYERIQFHIPNVPQKLLDDFLNRAVGDELIYLEGIKRGYDKNPSLLSAVEEDINRSITKIFLDRKLEVKVEPSREELDRFYQENKFAFFVPKLYRLRQVMIKLKSKSETNDDQPLLSKAQQALLKIKDNPQNFENVVKEYSEGPEKPVGGDLGFLSMNQMVPEFQKIVVNMKIGEISDIIKTSFGYHIIKLEDEKEPYVPEYKEIEAKVKNKFIKNMWNQNFDNLIKNLRSKATIKVFEQYFIE